MLCAAGAILVDLEELPDKSYESVYQSSEACAVAETGICAGLVGHYLAAGIALSVAAEIHVADHRNLFLCNKDLSADGTV